MKNLLFPYYKEGVNLSDLEKKSPMQVRTRILQSRRDVILLKDMSIIMFLWCHNDPDCINIPYTGYAQGSYLTRKLREYRTMEYILGKPLESKQPEGWNKQTVKEELFHG